MSQYLYGASCQGIQSFIFETDLLREIGGGSELVEQLCTSKFEEFLTTNEINVYDYTKIIGAAGNIRYIFNEVDVAKVVLNFPKCAVKFAPGITISQGVQEISDKLCKADMNALEQKLKIQRNKAWRPADLGFLAAERCRRTARPAVHWDDATPLDRGLVEKRAKSSPKLLIKKLVHEDDLKNPINHIPFEMEHMIDPHKSEWLAVIHADGNNLGKMIQHMADELTKNANLSVIDAYKDFSNKLEEATTKAAQAAFKQVIWKDVKEDFSAKTQLPIRPILIGGDDLTVICRADLAIDFTKEFLEQFQKKTKECLKDFVKKYQLDKSKEGFIFTEGLTACAGIAFVKPKYPFHYAADLAEELCGAAKKASKNLDTHAVPASLAFFKVRSSYLDSYADLCKRELKAGDIDLNFGPYALDDSNSKMPDIATLKSKVEILREKESPSSSLRQWLSALIRDENEAKQVMKRLKQVTKNKYLTELELDDEPQDKETPNKETPNKETPNKETPIADWLSILSLGKGVDV